MNAVVPEDLGTPPVADGGRLYQRLLSGVLGMLGFFLLFSTAGTATSLTLLLLLALAAPRQFWRAVPWREPVLVAGLALMAYIALRTFLADGFTRDSLRFVNHYHELLLVPLLYGAMRMARRPQWFANGLLLAVAGLCALSWLAPFNVDAYDFMLRRRISAGFGLAVCAFLVFEHTRLGHLPRWQGYPAAAFLAATVLFTGQGRTGQLVLLFLVGCATFRALRGRWRLPLTLAALVLALAVAGLSPPIRTRMAETWATLNAPAGNVRANSTTGRLEILHNAVGVAGEHWALGTGWPHFPAALREMSARRHGTPSSVYGANSDNPHGEYLLQLGAGGLPALLLFVAWLASPVWRAWKNRAAPEPWTGLMACVTLAFALAALFNSVLMDWVEAHFYVALLAWLQARRIPD